jgi:hypothetical protein
MKNKSDSEEDRLESWEIKILEDENQPELYDTLEVLNIRDNIDKVAKAVIIINVISGIINFQYFQAFLVGAFPRISNIPEILWSLFLTAIGIGFDIAIVYFPLKALNQIIRILMEMEFNSRKAKS